MDLKTLIADREFTIGDRVYLNVPDGEAGLVIGYILYDTHLEYQVRTAVSVLQVEEIALCSEKQII